MQKRRYMIDTNVFIAGFKSGLTATTALLTKLLSDPQVEFVADEVLLDEYRRWYEKITSRIPTVRG